ncbi:NAD-dependent epimerase/dehydratase family protein [Litorivicinus lipolyticus]|uniref:NAD-dependent epimerase/dehydratase family protein n=1 Tax=Litorivicinus lipolyticus TaxID=418701 RepID=A0A5Q2Q8U1_9GAMM|nr:D-erythronate dehydrogenase [Litorivicinus lipolyticus]QGG79533.1 NAD-dependent epimerase/dehydratase family protein [Litorivicinus lipolyticus]
MKVLIIGGGGFVGQKLARSLVARGQLDGQAIQSISLVDVVMPASIESAAIAVNSSVCDITDPASIANALDASVTHIFLLAAIVSAHAEEDFDAGMQINMQGVWNVLERARALGSVPKVIFTSSIAVYGGEVPDPITDHSFLNPQGSYGIQKAIGELLLNDYSRKGFVDGRGFRLPTISVRPGKPNRAASSFMSSILREPLNGESAVCPVDDDFLHYYLSPRKCVENLIKGAELAAADLGQNRCMLMPGKTWSIGQLIEALTAVAGPGPAQLIRRESQPDIQRIVKGWRFDFHADKALALGLSADESFQDNVRYYLEDDAPVS